MRRGELDMIVAGLAKNEQRLAYMDFTNSYYHSRSIYLGLPGSVAVSAEGLKGKRVGVQDHTQQEIFLRSHWVNVAEIIRFPTYGQLIDAFCAGQLDSILVDGLSGTNSSRASAASLSPYWMIPSRPTKTSPMPTSASGKTIPN